jgi:hypothetical protein
MVVLHMENTKPLVQAACICENVLLDKDGPASLIRIIDQITVHIPSNAPKGIPAGFPVQLFVRVGSGAFKGSGEISVQPKRPDGTRGGRIVAPIELLGEQRGVQFKSGFHVINPQQGVYWFDVLWNGEFLTSIPLEVTLAEAPIAPAMPTPPR